MYLDEISGTYFLQTFNDLLNYKFFESLVNLTIPWRDHCSWDEIEDNIYEFGLRKILNILGFYFATIFD